MDQSVDALTAGAMSGVWEWTRGRLPEGLEVFDAHSHIGEDLDGRRMTAEGMRERQEAAGVARSIVFPLNDPNASEDFAGPNDVLWEAYESYPDHLVPFFRLNPHQPNHAEFERCVGRGFVGLKLHPVSQKFPLDDPGAVELFEMAAEAGLPVLVHAGFGMERIVEPLLPTLERNPGLKLILGHSGMVDVLEASRAFLDYPNVRFDTSVVKAKDLYVLFRSVPPERVCYGSDIPYGDIPSTLHATLHAATLAGLTENELRGVLSDNIRRWFP
ncbi:amidohydrolase family protein [Rubrobacter aplysinae]|uniref:amidohydrolase family protein n=1 Tax=Rubrobacter aplysinae TaxID=909625 RepID=UPI00064BCEC7|nr:amidohydrolase family protein [Rubrobacter aplysinae]